MVERAAVVQLVYASRMSRKCGPRELENILRVSRRNNQAMGITGVLCYSPRGFLQCLEGPPEAVNELYRRIVRDDRNKDVTLISYGPANRRAFVRWSMACVRSDEADAALLEKRGVKGELDPYAVGPRQALGLLADIARERAAFLEAQNGDGA